MCTIEGVAKEIQAIEPLAEVLVEDGMIIHVKFDGVSAIVSGVGDLFAFTVVDPANFSSVKGNYLKIANEKFFAATLIRIMRLNK